MHDWTFDKKKCFLIWDSTLKQQQQSKLGRPCARQYCWCVEINKTHIVTVPGALKFGSIEVLVGLKLAVEADRFRFCHLRLADLAVLVPIVLGVEVVQRLVPVPVLFARRARVRVLWEAVFGRGMTTEATPVGAYSLTVIKGCKGMIRDSHLRWSETGAGPRFVGTANTHGISQVRYCTKVVWTQTWCTDCERNQRGNGSSFFRRDGGAETIAWLPSCRMSLLVSRLLGIEFESESRIPICWPLETLMSCCPFMFLCLFISNQCLFKPESTRVYRFNSSLAGAGSGLYPSLTLSPSSRSTVYTCCPWWTPPMIRYLICRRVLCKFLLNQKLYSTKKKIRYGRPCHLNSFRRVGSCGIWPQNDYSSLLTSARNTSQRWTKDWCFGELNWPTGCEKPLNVLFARFLLPTPRWPNSQVPFLHILSFTTSVGGVDAVSNPKKYFMPQFFWWRHSRCRGRIKFWVIAMFSAVQPARSVPPQIPNCLCLPRFRR